MRPRSRTPAQRAVVGLFTAFVGAAGVLASMTNAYGFARGTSFAPCFLAASVPAVTYSVTTSAADGRVGITGINVSDVSSRGCEGLPARALLEGNAAGDPAQPVTETLASLNSATDSCTHRRLDRAAVIADGAIRLRSCAGGPAVGTIDVHDLTRVELVVSGQHVAAQVEGERVGRGRGSTRGDDRLPFTGSWAAFTFWLGAALVLAGLSACRVSRRRPQG